MNNYPNPPCRKGEPRRGGWSGGPPPESNLKLMWWLLALGLIAVAISLAVIRSR